MCHGSFVCVSCGMCVMCHVSCESTCVVCVLSCVRVCGVCWVCGLVCGLVCVCGVSHNTHRPTQTHA